MLDACPPCSSGDVAAALRDVTGIAFPAGASRDLDHVLTTVPACWTASDLCPFSCSLLPIKAFIVHRSFSAFSV